MQRGFHSYEMSTMNFLPPPKKKHLIALANKKTNRTRGYTYWKDIGSKS